MTEDERPFHLSPEPEKPARPPEPPRVPEPPPPAAPAPPEEPPPDAGPTDGAGTRLAAFLADRGLGPVPLSLLAFSLAALGGVLFLLFHPRLGAVAGLIALAAQAAAVLPQPDGTRSPFARAIDPALDLLLMGGLIGLVVTYLGRAAALLTLLVLVLVAWLARLEDAGAPGGGKGLWRRADRLGIVLAGTLFGSVVWALGLVAIMGTLDAWVRLEHLHDPRRPGGPTFLRPLLQPDGRLVPAVRWGTLAFALLLLVLLRRTEGWPF